MGILKVDLSKGPPALVLSQKTKQKLLVQTAKKKVPELNKRSREKIRKLGNKHYRATMDAVRGALSIHNAPNVAVRSGPNDQSTVTRTIKFKDANGKSRRLLVGPWRKLSRRYTRRSPVNLAFWHKFGILEKNLKAATGKHTVTVRQAKGGGLVKESKGKVTIRTVSRIGTQRLKPPYGRMITDAFMQGKAFHSFLPAKGTDRKSDLRILYPETFRPFVSQLAAKMGQYFHTALRKLR